MTLLLLALSSLAAVLPMLLFLWIVWWMDRYDREPLWLLAIVFLWGAVGGIVLAVIGSFALLAPVLLVAPGLADVTSTVIIAPLIEEPAKAVILLAVLWNRHFDNMTDGFVYGAAAGLGFGMTENFLYFAGEAISGDPFGWVATVVIRTLYSAVMHASATAIVGAALGFARFRGCLALVGGGLGGLVMAMGVHALWNGMLTLDAVAGFGGALVGMNLLLFPLIFLFLFGVFHLCLLEEKVTIRRELASEAEDGVLSKEHARILSSYCARNRRAWVPAGVDHHAYVYAATELAMRKKQARLTHWSRERAYYQAEVERLRDEVRRMLDR